MISPDLIGRRFGKLIVVEKLQASRGGSVLWRCLCDCGNESSVSTRHLNRNGTTVRSCGCLRKLSGSDHKDWKGVGQISGIWWNLHVAREFKQKSRNKINIEIDKEYAWKLFEKQDGRCALSGMPLVIHNRCINNTASLDRIDSAKGYVDGNVQWVHKDINMMKRTYSQEYFMRLCDAVSKYTSGVCPIK